MCYNITVVDNSGVRVYYTERLRANDAGIMAVGTAVSPVHIIPPRQSAYRTSSLCDKDCTNVMFPERGVKITSVLLHAHLASRQLKLRHVRHDQEMATVAQVCDARYGAPGNGWNRETTIFRVYNPIGGRLCRGPGDGQDDGRNRLSLSYATNLSNTPGASVLC